MEHSKKVTFRIVAMWSPPKLLEFCLFCCCGEPFLVGGFCWGHPNSKTSSLDYLCILPMVNHHYTTILRNILEYYVFLPSTLRQFKQSLPENNYTGRIKECKCMFVFGSKLTWTCQDILYVQRRDLHPHRSIFKHHCTRVQRLNMQIRYNFE